MPYSILFLNWQDIKHPLGGGAEVYHHEILKRMAAQGHEITWLVSHYDGLSHEETIDGMKIVRTGNRNLFNYQAPKVVRKMMAENRYDIVIDSVNKIPLMSPGYVKNVPVIACFHHLFKKTIFSETIFPLALYVYLYERRISANYNNIPVISVSESTKLELVDYGMDPTRISIIENCVDHTLYQLPDDKTAAATIDYQTDGISSRSSGTLVGYLGRIKKYKSVDHLIRAFVTIKMKVANAELVIVGDGDNLMELRTLTKQLGLEDSVNFTGFLSEQKKVAILQQCDVVVNPSIKEGWGLTVIEANACGTPVVAADVPGLRDSVRDGETGVLYPYGDIDRCASEVISLLNDKERRDTLSEAAVKWAATFNWDIAAEKTLDLLKSTIDNFEKP